MTVPDFLSHLPKPLPIRDLRVFLRSRSCKWGTVMGDKFSNNFIRSYQVFQTGDSHGGQVVRYFHPLIIPGLPNRGRSAPTESPHWCPGLPDVIVGLTNNNIGCCWLVDWWSPTHIGWAPDLNPCFSVCVNCLDFQACIRMLHLRHRAHPVPLLHRPLYDPWPWQAETSSSLSIDTYPGVRNKYQQTNSQRYR